jgi:peptide/nickel transport system permease protein
MQRGFSMLLRSRTATFGAIILIVLLLAALFAGQIAPHDPAKQSLPQRLQPPAWTPEGSPDRLLGADQLGRDILSRLVYGARISLAVGVAAVVLATTLGTMVGLATTVAGWTPF